MSIPPFSNPPGVTKAQLNGGTLPASFTTLTHSGQLTTTANGAASAPPRIATGSLFTGGTATTTFPYNFFQPTAASAVTTWSTGGTWLGINTASGFAGNFVDFHINGGSSSFLINASGSITTVGAATIGATLGYHWNGRSQMLSPSDGVITLENNAGTSFTRLQFGGTTSSFPALKVNGTALNVRLADDSADAAITASNLVTILSTTTAISGTAIANTLLYTVPAGKTAVITGYVVRCTAATAITNGSAAGIGNVAGTNNISASQAMNTLTSTLATFQWSVTGISLATAAAGTIYYNQGTGATGTSQTIQIDLMGYAQ